MSACEDCHHARPVTDCYCGRPLPCPCGVSFGALSAANDEIERLRELVRIFNNATWAEDWDVGPATKLFLHSEALRILALSSPKDEP